MRITNSRLVYLGAMLAGIVMVIINYYFIRSFAPASLNRGFFLGIFSNNNIAILLSSVVFVAVIIFILIKNWRHFRLPLSLIIPGALSNLVSRILYGGVYDYIPLGLTTINIEDILIVVGFTLIIYEIIAQNKEEK